LFDHYLAIYATHYGCMLAIGSHPGAADAKEEVRQQATTIQRDTPHLQGETQLTQDFEEVHFMDETPKWRGIEQVTCHGCTISSASWLGATVSVKVPCCHVLAQCCSCSVRFEHAQMRSICCVQRRSELSFQIFHHKSKWHDERSTVQARRKEDLPKKEKKKHHHRQHKGSEWEMLDLVAAEMLTEGELGLSP
jgi:hypothetical protein